MEKKKNAWQTPKMEGQLFKPQEFCAICLEVACERGIVGGNSWDTGGIATDGNGLPHTMWTITDPALGGKAGEGCGHAKNQVFRLYSNDRVEMYEVNIPAASSGKIESTTRICNIDGWGGTRFSLETLLNHANQTIYWTTSGVQTDNETGIQTPVTYQHYGTLSMTNPRSVNAS